MDSLMDNQSNGSDVPMSNLYSANLGSHRPAADSPSKKPNNQQIEEMLRSNETTTHELELKPIWRVVSGQYRLNMRLGKGAFGDVIQAECKGSGQPVAIKLIDNYCKSEYTCVKVARELQIMKGLKDNKQAYLFIPEIIDVIQPTPKQKQELLSEAEAKQEHIFIVMEYIESDLKSLISISQGSNFSESHLTLILYYLLCGLKFLHSSNIIHRDLKPQNILVNSESQVKICDFGISRTLPESLYGKGSGNTKRVRDQVMQYSVSEEYQATIKSIVAKKVTQIKEKVKDRKRCLSTHVGSRWYRAPEISIIEKQYDQASDMWSLGCCLYELMYIVPINGEHRKKKGPCSEVIFRGNSCFPLSPYRLVRVGEEDAPNQISQRDQMSIILRKLCQTTALDFGFIHSKSAVQYLENFGHSETHKVNFRKQFAHIDSRFVDLLEGLLQVNPYFRPSATECLMNSIFDSIRCKEMEKSAKHKLQLQVDMDEAFDYEASASKKYSTKDYMEMIRQSTAQIHQERRAFLEARR